MRMLPILVVAAACAGEPPPRTPAQRATDTAPALTALRAGRFDAAASAATAALALDPHDSQAAAIRAIATYVIGADELHGSLESILHDADMLSALDHTRGRAMWTAFLDRLRAVDADLAVAAADPGFALELCPACWDHDWNESGAVDDHDRRFLEVELDRSGNALPEGDPRRRPTFRFDVGDLDWARSMVDFQRAAVELVLAYRWNALDQLMAAVEPHQLRITLDAPERVKLARGYLLDGVALAERCRREFLAETDDDREWVPNPHQHSYAVPLLVDDALFDRWGAVLEDVRRLVAGEDGISLREVAELVDRSAAARVPDAYIDVGRMFAEPADIVIGIDGHVLDHGDLSGWLRDLLGNGYAEHMRPSPIVGRLARAFGDVTRGEDTFDRKLHYLLWLN